MLKLNLTKLDPELRSAAREMLPEIGLAEADCGLMVEETQWENGLSVTVSGDNVKIDAKNEESLLGVEEFIVSLAKEQIRNINANAAAGADSHEGHDHG